MKSYIQQSNVPEDSLKTKVSKEIEIMFVDTFSSQLTSCSNTTVLLAV